jgi:hypothetical protein
MHNYGCVSSQFKHPNDNVQHLPNAIVNPFLQTVQLARAVQDKQFVEQGLQRTI